MTEEEIYSTWENCSQSDAFEAFDCDQVPIDDIEQLLGKDAAKQYEHWIYYHQK